MRVSKWRAVAAPIIREVLEETRGKPESEIRKALAAAYPFGQRAMHPYKQWLKEVRHQRGLPKRATAAADPEPSLFDLEPVDV